MLLEKLKIDLSEVEFQLQLLKLEYPAITSPTELTQLLNTTFDTSYSVRDISIYLDSTKSSEDFELESRKHVYGSNT